MDRPRAGVWAFVCRSRPCSFNPRPGPVGQQFRVDYADVLVAGTTNWQVLTNITLPSSPFVVVDYSSSGQTKRYYRAVPLP